MALLLNGEEKKLIARGALKIVSTARELVAKRTGWTQGCYARDVFGSSVDPKDPRASSFCARGAMFRAQMDAVDGTNLYHMRATDALYEALACKGGGGLVDFNDKSATHDDVVALFDDAISTLQKEVDKK